MPDETVVGIVLAGGASSRFGSDKLAAELDGQTLLHHALLAVAKVVHHMVVVLAHGAPDPSLPSSLAGRVFIAHDPGRHEGPLAGLAAGLASEQAATSMAAAEGVALVVAADMPWLAPDVLRLLLDRLGADPLTVAMTLDASPSAPLPVALRIGRAREAADVLLIDGRRSLRSLLDAVPASRVPSADWRALDPEGRSLRDVDTPADLEAS